MIVVQTVTVTRDAFLSDAIDCSSNRPVRVTMPASFTGGAFTVITFQISTDNINYYDYLNADGSEVRSVVTPGATVRVANPVGGHGTTWVKIRCGTRDAPVKQTKSISFQVVLEPPPA